MAETLPEIRSRTELDVRIAEILVSGSLYRRFMYNASNCHFSHSGEFGQQFRCAYLPENLHMFCESRDCQKETNWRLADREPAYFFETNPQVRQYGCRNCDNNTIAYWLVWEEHGTGSSFMKVGQWPPLAIQPTQELAKALGAEDAALYKKALINANFSHGMGALAYFRRVIENKANFLLDLIAEAATNAQFAVDELKNIEEIKKSQHLDKKIEYAARILPTHLRPGGRNPLGRLHGIASAGLHGESDDRCLELFYAYKFEFEYVFRNLTVSNAEAQEYISRVSKPISKS